MADIREATAADLPGITRVRTSVRENHLSVEQLAARGITEAAVAASFLMDSRGWVAVEGGEVVGFSIADRASGSIFALFILPGFDGRGLGTALLERAVGWLRGNGVGVAWLTTGGTTKAVGFYRRRGWVQTAAQANGEVRFELVL